MRKSKARRAAEARMRGEIPERERILSQSKALAAVSERIERGQRRQARRIERWLDGEEKKEHPSIEECDQATGHAGTWKGERD